jgi:signal transduction histidine kinase
MNFRNKATLGIGLALLAFASIGVFSYNNAIQEENDREWVTHTHLVLENIDSVMIHLTDAETGQRGFILTGEDSYLQPYWQGRSHTAEGLRSLREFTADNPVQQHNLDRLEPMVTAKFEELQDRIDVRKQRGLNAGVAAVNEGLGKNLMDNIRELVQTMRQEEVTLRQRRLEVASAASRRTRRVIILGNVLALLFLAIAGFVIQKEMGARKRGQDEIKRLNQDLEGRVEQLVSANRELDAFTHSLAHDLRAPLRHMHGFAELLREAWYDKFDEDGRHFLGKILVSSKEMGMLVDDLLNFSRLARVEVQASPVDPRELVDRARQELEPEIGSRIVTWEIAPLPSVRADPSLLYQALFNLLANAVKYTRKCTAARIEVGCIDGDGDGGDNVTLFVRDNGAGFDMQYVEKLFRVFQRLHRAEDFEGTGVGLANVRRIIERHGGRVWAEGSLGHGATFYLSLPAATIPNLSISTRRQDAEQVRVHSAGR